MSALDDETVAVVREHHEATTAVYQMVNEQGRPDVSKVAMLKVIKRLAKAERNSALLDARRAIEGLS